MNITVEQVELPAARTLVVRGRVAFSGIAEFLGVAFSETSAAASMQGLSLAGPPFGRYQPTEDGWDVEAGFPVVGTPVAAGRVEVGTLPGGRAVRVLHTGRYDQVGTAYRAIEKWLSEHGSAATAEGWESYLDEPSAPKPRTEIIQPCVPPSDASQGDPRARAEA